MCADADAGGDGVGGVDADADAGGDRMMLLLWWQSKKKLMIFRYWMQ